MIDQPQIRLVNERGRLERVVAPLPTQIACGAHPQISMDQLEEIVACLNVPACPRAKQERSRAGISSHLIGPDQTMWLSAGQVNGPMGPKLA